MSHTKKLLILISLIFLISIASANEINTLEENIIELQNQDCFDNFEVYLQLYIEEETYVILLSEDSSEVFEGEVENPHYIITTNEKDLKIVNELIDSYLEDGKISIFEKAKVLYLYAKYGINNNVKTVIDSQLEQQITGCLVTW